ncbi:thioredoxin-dependent thiol peroxidase [Occultella glacieicola]|uniref:thioredoxin-dependent peroxiredoxin n=1 Tax=Occultella glacieicola TaxID=2518684 RepID=A0ABY2E6C5_9MICO|nr:thioredoxin-dependent thiol peroxidase [Occultella glacieicola]TDE95921.1 thioredoxin-dependent thiol peroxidase [Occultella glacieicola]
MSRLDVGQPAPDFSLPTAAGEKASLADLRSAATNGVIVYFYPKASTPGCTTEACDFRDALASLQGAGYAVVGISADPIEDLQAFAAAQHLNFPLASDLDHSVADAYGTWGPVTFGDRTFDSVHRSTFVVAPDGTLASVAYDVPAQGHVRALREELGVA